MKISLRLVVQVLLFTLVGVAILYFMWQSLGGSYAEDCAIKGIAPEDCSLWTKLISDFRSTNYFWITIVCVTYLLSCVIRAIRWQMLLRPLGYQPSFTNSFLTIMVGYFANLGLPRMGEFVRTGLFSKYESVPYEKAFGTVVTERLIDLLCLLLLILLGVVLHNQIMTDYFAENLQISRTTIFSLLGLALIGGVGAIIIYRYLLARRIDNPILQKIKKLVEGFVDGLVSLRSVNNLFLFVVYSLSIWLMYVLMHWFAFLAYEPTAHVSFLDAILAFDFGALGMVFPSPGGMGSYHAMLVEALKILGVDEISGFSIAMISFFAINLFCNVIFGLLSVILLPIINKK